MIDYNRIADMAEHRRAQVRQEAEAAQLLRASRPTASSRRFAFFAARFGMVASHLGAWLQPMTRLLGRTPNPRNRGMATPR